MYHNSKELITANVLLINYLFKNIDTGLFHMQ